MAVKVELTCCLCAEPIPASSDVHPLDAEWQRRHPGLTGYLACRCALERRWYWHCDPPAPGHISPERGCVDSWSHLGVPCSHTGAVQRHPLSALRQGAQAYVRHTLTGTRGAPELRERLREALHRWEARG